MMRILDTRQMREADRRTIEDIGIPARVLMENAGRQVVAALEATFDDLATSHVAVMCGPGNNGGDGFVVARVLAERGIALTVVLVGQAAEVRGDARANLDVLRNLGIDVIEVSNAQAWELHGSDVLDADLVIDAMFGIGLRGALSGLAETIVVDLNASSVPVVAIDVPSGLSADTSDVPGPAINASITVALGAPKVPLVLPPAERLAGTLVIADIGIPEAVIESVEGPRLEVLTREGMRRLITPRSPDSHKGDFGRILVVAGSRGKSGAAVLAARAALRSGAGLVTIATPASLVPLVASLGAEFMTLGLAENAAGTVTEDALDAVLTFQADVLAVGPGLGSGPDVDAFVHGLVERAGVPIVLDADALNAFAGDSDRLVGREDVEIIITPHPGEMARLLGTTIDHIQARRVDVARDFAVGHHVHVVLKGHRTVVASPDGLVSLNLTGNPGMATGGAGDVLLGMIAGWFGQLLDAAEATRLAVYLHGLAGDLAESDEGEVALIAGDIISHLGEAVLDLTARRTRTAETPS